MHYFGTHILTITIFLPLLGIILLAFIPSCLKEVIRIIALTTSLVVAMLAAKLWFDFANTGEFEFAEIIKWIPSLNIYYRIGLDGVSLLMVLLTALLVPIAILSSWNEIQKQVKAFYILILALECGLLGVFSALDLFLFYIFWEVVLIPMYFLIGIWGNGKPVRSALKFFIYTMLGSVIMLAAILYGASLTGGSFDIISWYAHPFPASQQLLLFIGFGLAFGIKIPIFPLHTWLPDAHTDAPTAGSVILAGILLKMGVYGFYRLGIPIFPLATATFAPLMLTLAVISIIYGALVAMVQPDLKRLIAYSSVSHLGFVVLGLFALEPEAVKGAILQMFNHGLSTGALFLLVGMLYERRGSRLIADFGGIARALPMLSVFFIVVSLSSLGLPGLNNFVGEFLILLGSFQTQPVFALTALAGVVLVAIYMLWLVQRVFLGKLKDENFFKLPDLTMREYWVLVPIIILIIGIGVWPKPWLMKIEKSTNNFISFATRATSGNENTAK
ncbi:MAG: NADH-quinone oxidoreductase subunit M [Pseudomonadota bacterium]